MDLKDYVCYKKKDKIYSLGVEINSSLANDKNCLNYTENKNSNTNKSDKLFRYNLGIPLPLYLIQNEGKKIEQFFNDEKKDKKPEIKERKCIGQSLFDNLFDLQKYIRKIPKTRKKRGKKKRKTRKKSFFN
tara:strand:- start:157 stop:549 length:393 start_codon:yes stop_codon:yes gene_type:complete